MEEDTGFGLLDYMRSDEEPGLGRMATAMGFIALLIFLFCMIFCILDTDFP